MRSAGLHFRLSYRMGWPFWERMLPRARSKASVWTVKGREKSGRWRRGLAVRRVLRWVKVEVQVGVQDQGWLWRRRSVRGRVM